MGELFDQIPDPIKDHVKEITKRSGLPDTEESLEKISEGWLEKKRIFEEETINGGMIEVDLLGQDDDKGAIALTYSGSLVNIGPLKDNVRKVSYASIGLRRDVPDVATHENSVLASDAEIDQSIEFEAGPVKQTSPVYKICVFPEDLPSVEQEEKIDQVSTVIMDDFVEVNKTLIAD